MRRQHEDRGAREQLLAQARADPAVQAHVRGEAHRIDAALDLVQVAVAGEFDAQLRELAAQADGGLQQLEHAFARAQAPGEGHQVRLARDRRGRGQRHGVGDAHHARVARDAVHPRAPALGDHHDASRAREEEAHQRAAHRPALGVVEGREAAAVQVEDHRPARRHGERHEQALAPEARARGAVHVQHGARVAAEQREEHEEAVDRLEQLLQAGAVAVGGHEVHRPAVEQAHGAIGLQDRGDAAARLEGRAEHDDVGGFARHVQPSVAAPK
jgi:hypothetical protein